MLLSYKNGKLNEEREKTCKRSSWAGVGIYGEADRPLRAGPCQLAQWKKLAEFLA